MKNVEWDAYVKEELARPVSQDLGPGEPSAGVPRLEVDTVFADVSVVDSEAAELCLAGLLLRRNALGASHDISSKHDSWEAAWWHGIMHRREPDPGNAKYWYRRVGDVSLLDQVGARVRDETTLPREATSLVAQGWDPFGFIDLCEQSRDTGSELEQWCQEAQKIEWQVLFEHTWKKATSGEF